MPGFQPNICGSRPPKTGGLGIELNKVRQRDFDMRFGLRPYDVFTGHVSAYYDFGGRFDGSA